MFLHLQTLDCLITLWHQYCGNVQTVSSSYKLSVCLGCEVKLHFLMPEYEQSSVQKRPIGNYHAGYQSKMLCCQRMFIDSAVYVDNHNARILQIVLYVVR